MGQEGFVLIGMGNETVFLSADRGWGVLVLLIADWQRLKRTSGGLHVSLPAPLGSLFDHPQGSLVMLI